jgi:ribosomal protein S24E
MESQPEITQKVNTKEELIQNINEWIKFDNEITKLKAEIKERLNKKKLLTESLVNVMKNNSIDCFDINGGALVYKQKKTKKTISGKYLLAQLEQYYKDQPEIAKDITKRVLDNREEVIKEEIKRKIDK